MVMDSQSWWITLDDGKMNEDHFGTDIQRDPADAAGFWKLKVITDEFFAFRDQLGEVWPLKATSLICMSSKANFEHSSLWGRPPKKNRMPSKPHPSHPLPLRPSVSCYRALLAFNGECRQKIKELQLQKGTNLKWAQLMVCICCTSPKAPSDLRTQIHSPASLCFAVLQMKLLHYRF